MRKVLFLALAILQIASAMERYNGRCALATGTVSGTTVPLVATGCTVTVFNSGTVTLSTLFADDGITPLANPFTAQDGLGRFHFYAADGVYDVRMSGGTPTIGTVTIGAVSLGGAGGGGTVTSVTATAPVTSTGGTTPVIACPTCARTDANNVFGAFYADFAQIAAPASPGAGTRRLFVNSATGEYSLKRSDGTVISLETPAATGAPANATYITQTPNATLTNEQTLSTLATGLLKNTTGTGVLTIAVGGDLPTHTHTEAQISDLGAALAVLQTRTISTTSPLGGGGDLSANRTFTCATCEVTTAKDGVSGYAGLDASSRIKVAAFPVLTGDVTTPGGSFVTTLANSGVTPGTYTKLTVDAKGRATVGASIVAGDLPAHTHATSDITSGTLGETRGGTGESTYTAGDLLIGNAAGGLTKNTLTAGSNVTITPGDGTITIDTTGGGITDLNGQTANTQTFAVGSTGTDVNIVSAATIHTFHFPSASAANRGVLTAADWSLFNAKVATTRALICATGLTGCGNLSADRTLALDVNGLVTKGTAADGDLFLIYDPVAAAHRKMTRTTVLSGIGGTLIFQGVWDANTNTPTLADGTGTTNFYYIVSVAGTQNLGSGAQTFAIGDLVIHNGTAWKKVSTAGIGVTSFNSRLNAVVPVAGDYTAAMTTNTPAGGIAATEVQAAVNELDTEKATASATLTANLPVIGNGTNALTVGTRQGNTTKYVSYAGSAPATDDCAKFDSSGNLTTAGAACGSGGGTSTSHGVLYTSTPAGTAITANVYSKLAGATTSISLADFTMTADNRLRYDGAATIIFKFAIDAAIRGTSNNLSTSIRLAKNGTTDAVTRQTINLSANGRAELISTTGVVSLATNDFVEVWATAASNTTLTVDTMVLNVFATGGAAGANEFTDSLFRVIDDGDNTKKLAFQVSAVTTGTTRMATVPNADSTLVVADTGAANNFLTAISAAGAISKAQPAFTNLSGAATTTQLPAAGRARGFGANFGECGGTALTAGKTVYLPELPYACEIKAYSISADAGTATIKTWRVADGTAIPTAANSNNTAGVGLSVGTRVRSTTVTDFIDPTLDIHDVLAVNLFAVATATCVQVFIQCDI